MYEVEYYDVDGKKKKGEFIGSEKEIRKQLYKEGKTVIKIKKQKTFFKRKPKAEEIAIVLSSIADLLDAGVGLSKAVDTVAISLDKSSKMKHILSVISEGLKQGKNFPEILEEYKDMFGDTAFQMLKAGYETGKLAETMRGASNYLLNLAEIRKEMIKRISYPVTVLVIGIFALLLNTNFIIPKITSSEMFKSLLKGEENLALSVLIKFSQFLPVAIGILVMIIVLGYLYYRQKPEEVEKILIKIPLIRELIFYKAFFIAFSSFARLIESGVKVSTALEIVAKSTRVYTVKQEFINALAKVKEGGNFAHGFSHISTIDKTILETVTNEERMRKGLEIIADRFYKGYIEKIKSLAPKVYAVVMVFVGFVFLLMVFAIGVPYAKLLSSFG